MKSTFEVLDSSYAMDVACVFVCVCVGKVSYIDFPYENDMKTNTRIRLFASRKMSNSNRT